MSDPVTNSEIEDVLSSIRRLVSVENRTDGAERPQRERAVSQDTPHDRGFAKKQPWQVRDQAWEDTSSEPDVDEQIAGFLADVPAEEESPKEPARLVLTSFFRVDTTEAEYGADEDDVAKADYEAEDDSASDQTEESDHLTLSRWQVRSLDDDKTADSEDATLVEGQDEFEDSADMATEDAEHAEDAQDDRAEEDSAPWSVKDDSSQDNWAADDADTAEVQEEAEAEAEHHADHDAEAAEDLTDAQDAVRAEEDHHQTSDATDESEPKDAWAEEQATALDPEHEQDEQALVDDAHATDHAEAEEATEAQHEDEFEGNAEDHAEHVPSELEARIAEVEAAVAAREDQWEPDGDSDDVYAGSQTDPLPWEDHVTKSTPMFEVAAKAMAAQAKYEAAQQNSAEPEIVPDPEPKPEPVQDRFTAPVEEATPAPEAKPHTPAARDGQGSWYSDDADAILDEDALRDLVSEIVRQELQGTLGERITRNVRKLVRREIHRAMMGQDLD